MTIKAQTGPGAGTHTTVTTQKRGSMSSRVVWVDEDRLRMVEAYVPDAVAEVLGADLPKLQVAERGRTEEVWGAPTVVHFESLSTDPQAPGNGDEPEKTELLSLPLPKIAMETLRKIAKANERSIEETAEILLAYGVNEFLGRHGRETEFIIILPND